MRTQSSWCTGFFALRDPLCDSMYCSYQGPPSTGFSRQEYWSGLPFPSPGDPPTPGTEPGFPHIVGRRFTVWATTEVRDPRQITQTLPCGSAVKNLPVIQKTQVQSLGGEGPLEKGMATHSSVLTWKIPWTEESGSYSPWGHKELDKTEQLPDYHTWPSDLQNYHPINMGFKLLTVWQWKTINNTSLNCNQYASYKHTFSATQKFPCILIH